MPSKEDLVVRRAEDIATLDDSVRIAGEIDPRVYRIVGSYLAVPTARLLTSLFHFDGGILSRVKQGDLVSPPTINTLHDYWTDSLREIRDPENGGRMVNDFVQVQLLGATVKDLYTWIAFSEQFTELLLGAQSFDKAAKCTAMFANYLAGKPEEAQRVIEVPKRGGIFGVLQSLLDSGPNPGNDMYEMVKAAGDSAGSDRFLKALSVGFALKANAIVISRQALERASKAAEREIGRSVDRPNKVLQTAGSRVRTLEPQFVASKEIRDRTGNALAEQIDSGENIEGNMADASSYAKATKDSARLGIERLQLLLRYNTAKTTLLSGGRSADVIVQGQLRSIALNHQFLCEGLVHTVGMISLAAANVRAAVVEAAGAENRAEMAHVLYEYQKAIAEIPAQIRGDIAKRFAPGGNKIVEIEGNKQKALPSQN